MPPLPVPREEALALAMAMGRSRSMASSEAGYVRHRDHRARAARPQIVARARALGDSLHWVEACEAEAMIRALMRLARKAGDMPTAAAMTAARGLLVEAAKLKGRLEDKVDKPADVQHDVARFLPLSDEDWVAEYGHRG